MRALASASALFAFAAAVPLVDFLPFLLVGALLGIFEGSENVY
jgi:hypothetical protein